MGYYNNFDFRSIIHLKPDISIKMSYDKLESTANKIKEIGQKITNKLDNEYNENMIHDDDQCIAEFQRRAFYLNVAYEEIARKNPTWNFTWEIWFEKQSDLELIIDNDGREMFQIAKENRIYFKKGDVELLC